MNKLSLPSLLLLVLSAAAAISGRAQTSLYSTNFANATSNGKMGSVSWNGFTTVQAFDVSNTANGASFWNPNTSANTGSASSINLSTNLGGYVVVNNNNTGGSIFASYTTNFSPINIASYSSLTFAVKQNSTVGSAFTSYFLIQVGGTWYTSATPFTVPTGSDGSPAQMGNYSLSFSSAASAWNVFTLTPSSPASTSAYQAAGNGTLAIGSVAGSALSGNITAAGFVTVASAVAASRVDDFAISGVAAPIPEPSTCATLAAGSALAFGALRRRRRRRA